MTTLPDTITCPRCRNINPWSADRCLNPECALPLGPIRALLAEQPGVDVPPNPAPSPAAAKPEQAEKPIEPAPPLPELPDRGEHPPSAARVATDQFLVVGIGDRADEIRARFFRRLADAGIEGLKLSTGQLVIDLGEGKLDRRPYDFAERDLGDEAVATMAVRMSAIGKDLYVNWRHYTLPPTGLIPKPDAGGCGWAIFWGGLIAAAVLGIAAGSSSRDASGAGWLLFLVGAGIAIAVALAVGSEKSKQRLGALQGFQPQESNAFQLAVRGAMLSAIDDAGIDRALVQRQDDGRGSGNGSSSADFGCEVGGVDSDLPVCPASLRTTDARPGHSQRGGGSWRLSHASSWKRLSGSPDEV